MGTTLGDDECLQYHGGKRRKLSLMHEKYLHARRFVVGCAVVVGMLAGSSPSSAGAATVKACTLRSTTTPFVPWGDSNRYFVAPSGTFEYGVGSWTATGWAWTVSENEPWRVNGASDMMSMQLLAGSSVTSRGFCVGADEDSIRLFVRRPGITGAKLVVHVIATGVGGGLTTQYSMSGDSYGWTPTPRIKMPDLRDINGQQTITIVIAPAGTAAGWLVDDVMVDPWRAK